MDYLEEIEQHRKNGCSWGAAIAPEDYDECCDCEDE